MDTSLAQAVVETNIQQMIVDLGVQDWNLRIAYERLDEKDAAQVSMLTDYKKATIVIDPDKHDDPEEVLRSLRHELLHLHLGPYDLVEETMMQVLTEANRRVFSRLLTAACEQTIRNLEGMLEHGFGYVGPAPKPKLKVVPDKKKRRRK